MGSGIDLCVFLLLPPPDPGHESRDEAGDENRDDTEVQGAFGQKRAEDEQKSQQKEAFPDQTVGFAPDLVAGKDPRGIDAEVEIALEIGHEIPDHHKQDGIAKGDVHEDGNCTGIPAFS